MSQNNTNMKNYNLLDNYNNTNFALNPIVLSSKIYDTVILNNNNINNTKFMVNNNMGYTYINELPKFDYNAINNNNKFNNISENYFETRGGNNKK